MERKVFEHLMKEIDVKPNKKVDFSKSVVPGELIMVHGWLDSLNQLISDAAMQGIALDEPQAESLHELKKFLESSIDETLKKELAID